MVDVWCMDEQSTGVLVLDLAWQLLADEDPAEGGVGFWQVRLAWLAGYWESVCLSVWLADLFLAARSSSIAAIPNPNPRPLLSSSSLLLYHRDLHFFASSHPLLRAFFALPQVLRAACDVRRLPLRRRLRHTGGDGPLSAAAPAAARATPATETMQCFTRTVNPACREGDDRTRLKTSLSAHHRCSSPASAAATPSALSQPACQAHGETCCASPARPHRESPDAARYHQYHHHHHHHHKHHHHQFLSPSIHFPPSPSPSPARITVPTRPRSHHSLAAPNPRPVSQLPGFSARSTHKPPPSRLRLAHALLPLVTHTNLPPTHTTRRCIHTLRRLAHALLQIHLPFDRLACSAPACNAHHHPPFGHENCEFPSHRQISVSRHSIFTSNRFPPSLRDEFLFERHLHLIRLYDLRPVEHP
ncbi:hypothetical protein Q7P37_004299 [Cladosporium fusiforme]